MTPPTVSRHSSLRWPWRHASALRALRAQSPAPAYPDDQRFADAVKALGLPAGPDVDLPAVGHRICEMITTGRASNINPVPTVRGVVNTLRTPA